MLRYLKLLYVQFRASLLVAAQYRADFLVDGGVEILWSTTALTPLLVVYGKRDTIAGWSFGEALVVVGFFTLLQAILEGAINPSLIAVVEHIRKGTLDFILLKPVDAQFLVSTARFQPWRSVNVVTAGGIFLFAFRALGRAPTFPQIALSLTLFTASIATLYSFWILVISTAFYAVKLDNLTELFNSIFDAARWPVSVFRGAVKFVLTFVIPLALMTTIPARALLGAVEVQTVAAALGGALAFVLLARLVWIRSLAGYTSASG